MTLHTHIALLRGINVGGRSRVPMAELRALCEQIGWRDVRTYIQSGNIIFRSTASGRRLAKQLEDVLPAAFGVTAAVIVRTADEWADYARSNPFPEESRTTPNLVMLALSGDGPAATALDTLRQRADSERLERVGDALWIHYGGGVGRSRLTPGLLDRAVGSPTTTRNWRTVVKLSELAGA